MSLDSGSFAEGLALAILGRAIHAAGTRSLEGMAELTFYDTLVAVAAAEGARRRAAWIIDRERKPSQWKGEERVDLVVSRISRKREIWVSAAELKWWRAADKTNASNRRRDLVIDFIRAASVHGFVGVEEQAFVVLVSTGASWNATTSVKANSGDQPVCERLNADGAQSWSMTALSTAPAVKNAVARLSASVPLASAFQTTLLRHHKGPSADDGSLEVRVWKVRKPQKSKDLSDAALAKLFPTPSKTIGEGKTNANEQGEQSGVAASGP